LAILTGRKGVITERDQLIFETVFVCRYLSTRQLTRLFFNSTSRARTRLPELGKKGYLDKRSVYLVPPVKDHPGVRETVWHLTKGGFDSVAETLDSEETYTPKQLLPEKARHYVRTNEVYVAARPALDRELGQHPGWEWRHEKRAADAYEYADASYVHQPDAHLLFLDHVFIVERQTDESKLGPKGVYKKLEAHGRYAKVVLKKPEETQVLFACDDPAVAAAAERAGREYGVYTVAGDVGRIAHHLYQSALRLS
jgi:hypothetical protein